MSETNRCDSGEIHGLCETLRIAISNLFRHYVNGEDVYNSRHRSDDE